MTNREIEKWKNECAAILKELECEKVAGFSQHALKLVNGVKKLQKLSEVVDARRYMGTGLRDMESTVKAIQTGQMGIFEDNVSNPKCQEYERICKEISDNILYKLQTEMMFNACVSAKWSCLFAAVAAIAACISIGLTWWLN